MNKITIEAFGWLSDDRVDQLRKNVKTARKEYPRFADLGIRVSPSELESLLDELVARRIKDSKDIST